MKRIVFGSTGLLGSAFMRKYPNAIGLSSKDFDFSNAIECGEWFSENENLFDSPVTSYLCMGNVAGIKGQNNFVMMTDNSLMTLNLLINLNAIQIQGRIVYFGSSCIYPTEKRHSFKESDVFSGPFEKTNEGYAIAKSLGVKFCEYSNDDRYLAVIPPNLVGPNDNWNLETSHVFPAMISKIIEAKKNNVDKIVFMGNNDIRREFLHVDDLVDGTDFYIKNGNNRIINIGFGNDISLGVLSALIADYVGYTGSISFNGETPGIYRKLMDNSSMLNLGWSPKINILTMIKTMVEQYEAKNN